MFFSVCGEINKKNDKFIIYRPANSKSESLFSYEDLMPEYKQRLNKIEVALSALELKNLEENHSDKQLSAKKNQLEAIRVKPDARYKDLSEFRCPG
jgi:hypothetical protein